jgi:SAM-dependent methyltransferase
MAVTKNWFDTWFSQCYYNMLYQHRDEDEAAGFLDALTTYLSPQKNACMLDAACGKGRHAILLAEKGFDVTGIDLSAKNIAEAKTSEEANLSFFVHDMRNLFRINYFDYIFNFYTSFGYFDSVEQDIKCINAFAAGLKPGGKMIIDFLNVTTTLQHLVEDESKQMGDILFNISKSYADGMISKKIVVREGKQTFTYHEHVRALQLKDFEHYCAAAGLKIINTFGSYTLAPFNKLNSDRLIIIAQK